MDRNSSALPAIVLLYFDTPNVLDILDIVQQFGIFVGLEIETN